MIFIGIDLAWGERNTTAAVALRGAWHDSQLALTTVAAADNLSGDAEIVAFVRESASEPGCVVGIDAPLDVPNATGERPVEAALRRCFGPYQAGAHPANRQLFGNIVRGERLAAKLEAELGLLSSYEIVSGTESARNCIEVFPHPAHIVLFGLERTLKYKGKPGRDYPSRYAAYDRLLEGIASLSSQDPALQPPAWLVPPTGLIGGRLKRYEDQVDALICAYVAACFWRWGDGAHCMVIGDKATGYVVTPITLPLRHCIETYFANTYKTSNGQTEEER